MENLNQTFIQNKPSLKRILKSLGFWVIIGIIADIILGYTNKELALISKPGVDYFIHALKILIGPIIFVTLVLGIISLESLKKVGSLGIKAVIYFEIVSTFALAIGIFMANIMQPGQGMNLDPNQLDSKLVEKYILQTNQISASSEIMHILQDAIPTDIITPFTDGKTIQVLIIAIITALIISLMKTQDKQAIQRVFEVIQNFNF
ncbi:C4-dicarboxylate transport protein [Campylobacter hepaticus]